MFTRAGWIAVGTAVVGAVIGRAFAIQELFILAAGVLTLAVVALLWVRLSTIRLRISRSVQPARVYAGETTRIEIAVRNSGASRTPVLALADPVAGTRGAHLNLAPLAGGDIARAAYRLPTSRRGIVRVGPLNVEVSDPFGLVTRRAVAAPVLDVTVFPAIHRIDVPDLGGDEDPHGNSARHNMLGRTSDEFFAMRQYVIGDDLRRVNWKATARSNDLMVRQDESPWQDRTTVLLDTRETSYDEESFERAVSAAASVVVSAFTGRHHVRFLSADGTDSQSGSGLAHSEHVLEYLAGVEVSSTASLRESVATLARSAEGGLLVVVGGELLSAELVTIAQVRRRFRRVVVVACHGAPASSVPAGLLLADLTDPATSFPDLWKATAKPRPRKSASAAWVGAS